MVFQFTGSAAGRASDFAKFCTDAILIDKHMDEPKLGLVKLAQRFPFDRDPFLIVNGSVIGVHGNKKISLSFERDLVIR